MARSMSAANSFCNFGNELLDKLSKQERERLARHFEHVALARCQVLYNEGDRANYVYFPKDCLISLVAMTEDAQTLEVGVVARKGAMGVPAIFRTNEMPYRAIVQIPGDAWKIRASVLRAEFDQGQQLHDVLLRYCSTLLTQITQSAVCHRFHRIEARLSRWLLDCQYHTGKDLVNLTHEILAMMLGTSRTLITTTAFKLQQAGAISYRQGQLKILDRVLLESLSCECHKIVKDNFARSLGL